MAKLYFKYGVMGSSKTAQLLITKFNYEERGMQVLLLKPATDTRDGVDIIKSRIEGLAAKATIIPSDLHGLFELVKDNKEKYNVILVDEAQFLTKDEVNILRLIVDDLRIPVLCFGLRTDCFSNLFEGSRRLLEVADEIEEIKTMCKCGRKAIFNPRLKEDGTVETEGSQLELGGNDRYTAMCSKCYFEAVQVSLLSTFDD